MLSYIQGKIIAKSASYLIVENGGLGYQIFVNTGLYADAVVNNEIELYLHQHIREDANDLYGLKNLAELELFELLLSISGIGPKSALAVLSVAGIDEIKQAIANGDSGLLMKVSGIGRKTAERVVLELKEKIGYLPTAAGQTSAKSDEIDALIVLGYSLIQAREALNNIDQGIVGSGERIKAALKGLGK